MTTSSAVFKISTVSLRLRNASVAFFLCLSIFVFYFNTLGNDFVADDYYTIELSHDSLSLRGLIAAFTSSDRLVNTDVSPYYRPLTRFSFLIDQYFFGLRPWGFHFVNIALHALCSVLLYFVLIRLECGFPAAFGASLLFAVHPVNAESVNFISARNNILETLFVLGSLYVTLFSDAAKKWKGHLLAASLFFLAILSKETALMLLPFLLFLKIYKEQTWRTPRSILQWDTTFIIFHVVFLGVYVLLRLFALDNAFIHDHFSGLTGRLTQIFYIIPEYFSLIVFPKNLTFRHIVPQNYSAIVFPLVLKWTVLAGCTFYVIRKRSRTTDIGIAWVIINSIPISNIIPIPSASMAERYLYTPIIGFLLVAADVLNRALIGKNRVVTVTAFFSLLAVALGITTHESNVQWKNDLALSKNIVRTNPSSAIGHFELGYELYLSGDHVTAEKEFKTALTLDPGLPQATWIFYYLGALNTEAGDFKSAEEYFSKSTKADPGNSTALYAMGMLSLTRNTKVSLKALDAFLATTALPDYPFMIEVKNNVPNLKKDLPMLSPGLESQSDIGSSDKAWDFFYRYPSGTRLFYKISKVDQHRDNITLITEQRLSRFDKHVYATRIIRFPLNTAVKARFVFDLRCRQHMAKLVSMEFRSSDDRVLGAIWPEKEYSEMNDYTGIYEYLLPNTLMRSLSENVCKNAVQ